MFFWFLLDGVNVSKVCACCYLLCYVVHFVFNVCWCFMLRFLKSFAQTHVKCSEVVKKYKLTSKSGQSTILFNEKKKDYPSIIRSIQHFKYKKFLENISVSKFRKTKNAAQYSAAESCDLSCFCIGLFSVARHVCYSVFMCIG